MMLYRSVRDDQKYTSRVLRFLRIINNNLIRTRTTRRTTRQQQYYCLSYAPYAWEYRYTCIFLCFSLLPSIYNRSIVRWDGTARAARQQLRFPSHLLTCLSCPPKPMAQSTSWQPSIPALLLQGTHSRGSQTMFLKVFLFRRAQSYQAPIANDQHWPQPLTMSVRASEMASWRRPRIER